MQQQQQYITDETGRRIATALEKLAGLNTDDLGFVSEETNGQLHYIFANRQRFDAGHMLDDNDQPMQLPSNVVRGRVVDLDATLRQHNRGDSWKVRVHIEAGNDRIIIEASAYTYTGRSLLAGLRAAGDWIKGNLTFHLKPGDSSKSDNDSVLFVNVSGPEGERLEGDDTLVRIENVAQAFQEVRTHLGLGPADKVPNPQEDSRAMQVMGSQQQPQQPQQPQQYHSPQQQSPSAPPQQPQQYQGPQHAPYQPTQSTPQSPPPAR